MITLAKKTKSCEDFFSAISQALLISILGLFTPQMSSAAFILPTVSYSVGTSPASIFAANLDSDSDNDLAVANYSSNTISILLNNGNGTFAAAVNYSVGVNPNSVFAADFDLDGDRDLATANEGSDTISILLNNGNGTFAAAVNYATDSLPTALAAIDLDLDGDSDLATANLGGDTVSILLNNGNGTFAAAVNYSVGTAPISIFAANLDLDSDNDLVAANLNSNTISVLLNNGNGTFATALNYSVGTNPSFVSAADFDNDSDKDLAVANSSDNAVSILLNDAYVPPSPQTSSPIPPLINVRKVPSPLSLPDGPGSVTYSYTVTNPGRITMTDITLVDNKCPDVLFISGDTNANTWLETNETWTYRCTTTLLQTTINYATARGLANDMAAVDTAIVEIFVGVPVTSPLIHLTKIPEPLLLPLGGGSVTYTYSVTNPGIEPLSQVTVTGDACLAVKYVGGDLNQNSLLEPTETWTYQCTVTLFETTASTAVATGNANGRTAIDPATALVVVEASPVPPAPGPYSVADALASSPTINIDKSLLAGRTTLLPPCTSGSLFKLPDDNNPTTQNDTSVYYCGADGKRYSFPNEAIYSSWYPDFSGVVTLSPAEVAAIPLRGNVTYRPGSRLVKVTTDSKVYAVEKGGVLRWIVGEVTAETLYGPNWNTFVKDIPDTLFTNYVVGYPITLADAVPAR